MSLSDVRTRTAIIAQLAVAIRIQAKKLLKIEKRKHGGIPIYYEQALATMISRNVEIVEQTTATALAALSHGEELIAETLAKSSEHQLLATKSLYEAFVLSVETHRGNIDSRMT